MLKMKNMQFALAIGVLGTFLATSLNAGETRASSVNSSRVNAASCTTPNAEKTRQLVQGQYFGHLRLRLTENEYINHQFRLQNFFQDPGGYTFIWETHKGTYNHLTGYWIFIPNMRQCWQAHDCNGPLYLWNLDGDAKGNPEDWELFVFESVEGNRVRVRNIYGRYVRYDPPGFVCDGDVNQAAIFQPLFD